MYEHKVAVVNTDINTHKQSITEHNLRFRWSVNARRPLSYTISIKLLSAISQGIAPEIKAA